MAPFESGRRLCLLFEAGSAQFALEATSVVEVAHPDAAGLSIRGVHVLRDLSLLLAGEAEERPGMGVVLDTSPTLSVRVKKIVGVADLSRAPFFLLPPQLSQALGPVARAAVLYGDRLYLELLCDALPHQPAERPILPPRPVYPCEAPPDRALVVESLGRLYGLALPWVSQVLPATASFWPMPWKGGPLAGFFPHGQVLWPIYSPAGLLGGDSSREEFLVLTELAGQDVGLSASRVLGVHQNFAPSSSRGEFICPALDRPALFLDLQRMFS